MENTVQLSTLLTGNITCLTLVPDHVWNFPEEWQLKQTKIVQGNVLIVN